MSDLASRVNQAILQLPDPSENRMSAENLKNQIDRLNELTQWIKTISDIKQPQLANQAFNIVSQMQKDAEALKHPLQTSKNTGIDEMLDNLEQDISSDHISSSDEQPQIPHTGAPNWTGSAQRTVNSDWMPYQPLHTKPRSEESLPNQRNPSNYPPPTSERTVRTDQYGNMKQVYEKPCGGEDSRQVFVDGDRICLKHSRDKCNASFNDMETLYNDLGYETNELYLLADSKNACTGNDAFYTLNKSGKSKPLKYYGVYINDIATKLIVTEEGVFMPQRIFSFLKEAYHYKPKSFPKVAFKGFGRKEHKYQLDKCFKWESKPSTYVLRIGDRNLVLEKNGGEIYADSI